MNLFDKIPEKFFSILVSKNKKIYVDALFVLGEAFRQEMAISRDNIVARLINNLEEEFNAEDFCEDDDAQEIKDNNVSSKACFLLRKLKSTGWIEMEMQRDSFEEYIILPDYAIKFINLLYSIVKENQIEYSSYVFATYSSLKLASVQKEETYNAIITAYHNTIQLMDELKSLYNNLGRFHKKMCNQDNINDVIKEHFIEYKKYSDEMIFPRFTRDSIPRYKSLIKEMLDDILADKERLQDTISVASKNRKYGSREETESDILSKIGIILEIYQNIDFTMNQIEQKNTEYVRASIQRIQYLLTSDKELKGKMVKLLKNSKKQEVIEKMENEVGLLRQEYVGNDSIYIRNSNDKKRQGVPMSLKKEKMLDTKVFFSFAKALEKVYGNEKINDFMERNFKNKPFIYSNEIILETTEDLILLILATIKADKSGKSFYVIEDSNEVIVNNGFQIPNIKFVRREK